MPSTAEHPRLLVAETKTNESADRTAAKIRCSLRVRPFTSVEKDTASCLRIGYGVAEIVSTPVSNQSGDATKVAKRKTDRLMCSFDYIFDCSSTNPPDRATQSQLFDAVGQPVVEDCIQGYNSSLFAYGPTGSGKTYTMFGRRTPSGQEIGITGRFTKNLFDRIEALKQTNDIHCKVSFMEIYNDKVRDLLVVPPTRQQSANGSSDLRVRIHPVLGVFVDNLMECACTTEKEVMDLIDYGCAMRSVSVTAFNSRSSRSHTIISFKVHRTSTEQKRQTTTSQVQLIDLAGYEARIRGPNDASKGGESSHINASLLNLKHCVSYLAKQSRRSKSEDCKAPWETWEIFGPMIRKSTLTTMLSHSLGGNSRASVIECVSPSVLQIHDTIAAFRFAQDVQDAMTYPQVNIDYAVLVNTLKAHTNHLISAVVKNSADQNVHRQLSDVQEAWHDEVAAEKYRQVERSDYVKNMGLAIRRTNVDSSWHAPTEDTTEISHFAKAPYLSNLSSDPFLQGRLTFVLSSQETLIGASDDCDVVLKGAGVLREHCRLFINELDVSVELCDEDARVSINGTRIPPLSWSKISAGSTIVIGHAFAFRLEIPSDSNELADLQADSASSFIDALDSALLPGNSLNVDDMRRLSQIAESSSVSPFMLSEASPQEHGQFSTFVFDLARRQSEQSSSQFKFQWSMAQPLIDEANYMATKLKVVQAFTLKVQLDVLHYDTNIPDLCVIVECSKGEQKLWTWDRFNDELQKLRDAYEERRFGSASKEKSAQHTNSDPTLWSETASLEPQLELRFDGSRVNTAGASAAPLLTATTRVLNTAHARTSLESTTMDVLKDDARMHLLMMKDVEGPVPQERASVISLASDGAVHTTLRRPTSGNSVQGENPAKPAHQTSRPTRPCRKMGEKGAGKTNGKRRPLDERLRGPGAAAVSMSTGTHDEGTCEAVATQALDTPSGGEPECSNDVLSPSGSTTHVPDTADKSKQAVVPSPIVHAAAPQALETPVVQSRHRVPKKLSASNVTPLVTSVRKISSMNGTSANPIAHPLAPRLPCNVAASGHANTSQPPKLRVAPSAAEAPSCSRDDSSRNHSANATPEFGRVPWNDATPLKVEQHDRPGQGGISSADDSRTGSPLTHNSPVKSDELDATVQLSSVELFGRQGEVASSSSSLWSPSSASLSEHNEEKPDTIRVHWDARDNRLQWNQPNDDVLTDSGQPELWSPFRHEDSVLTEQGENTISRIANEGGVKRGTPVPPLKMPHVYGPHPPRAPARQDVQSVSPAVATRSSQNLVGMRLHPSPEIQNCHSHHAPRAHVVSNPPPVTRYAVPRSLSSVSFPRVSVVPPAILPRQPPVASVTASLASSESAPLLHTVGRQKSPFSLFSLKARGSHMYRAGVSPNLRQGQGGNRGSSPTSYASGLHQHLRSASPPRGVAHITFPDRSMTTSAAAAVPGIPPVRGTGRPMNATSETLFDTSIRKASSSTSHAVGNNMKRGSNQSPILMRRPSAVSSKSLASRGMTLISDAGRSNMERASLVFSQSPTQMQQSSAMSPKSLASRGMMPASHDEKNVDQTLPVANQSPTLSERTNVTNPIAQGCTAPETSGVSSDARPVSSVCKQSSVLMRPTSAASPVSFPPRGSTFTATSQRSSILFSRSAFSPTTRSPSVTLQSTPIGFAHRAVSPGISQVGNREISPQQPLLPFFCAPSRPATSMINAAPVPHQPPEPVRSLMANDSSPLRALRFLVNKVDEQETTPEEPTAQTLPVQYVLPTRLSTENRPLQAFHVPLSGTVGEHAALGERSPHGDGTVPAQSVVTNTQKNGSRVSVASRVSGYGGGQSQHQAKDSGPPGASQLSRARSSGVTRAQTSVKESGSIRTAPVPARTVKDDRLKKPLRSMGSIRVKAQSVSLPAAHRKSRTEVFPTSHTRARANPRGDIVNCGVTGVS